MKITEDRIKLLAFRLVGGLILPAWVIGCRPPPSPPYANWAEATNAPLTQAPVGNAYRGYVAAAELAERAGPEMLTRVTFTPGQKQRLLSQLAPALSQVELASRRRSLFVFAPSQPFSRTPYRAGWRLLGRALVWRIEIACALGEWSKAVKSAGVAMKFGFDLTGGGAIDASLGYAIVDEARRALAPSLAALPVSELSRLEALTRKALFERPDPSIAVRNEGRNMMLAVQYLQDSYRAQDYAELTKALGKDVKDALEYLKQMQRRDAEERPTYFQSLANEAALEISALEKQIKLPASERPALPQPSKLKGRPWRRLARYFFGSARPLLALNDRVTARVRLLGLHARILRIMKSQRSFPVSLQGMPPELIVDPYTGKPFIYKNDTGDYRVYSVGVDLRDDGGESDETGLQPDLVLEEVRR